MAATTPSNSGSVLPGWMWPSSAAAAAAAAENFERKKTVHEDTARQYRVAAGQLGQMTEGAFSEEAILAHQLLAVDHVNIARIDDEFAATGRRLAEMAHDLSARLDGIDSEARQEISSSPQAGHAAIISKAQTEAAAVLAAFTADVAGVRAQAEKEVGRLTAGIIGRDPSSNDPSTQALDNGLEQRPREDRGTDVSNNGLDQRGSKTGADNTGSNGKTARDGLEQHGGKTGGIRAGDDGLPPTSSSAPDGLEQRGSYAELPLTGSTSLAPRTPLPSPLSGGGAPGVGALSAGGLGGLGGGNPLSGLSSGARGLPGTTSPSGLSGVPSLPGAGVDPAASFTRSMAASSGVGALPPVSPPPALPGTASPAAASPVAGAVSAPPAATSAGLAASGAHTPAPAVGTPGGAAAGAPGAGGMMLPPAGMGGPPASPAVAGGAATTVPATATPASSGGGGAGSGGAVNPNAGATLVPASVVTPAAVAAQRARSLSEDTLAAAALAWSLARSGDLRAYPLDWAVVVFRSPSGSETVVMSGDGSGYVPVGVFLPRSARLMVSDPLVDGEFRQRWFGWADPARLLVEYAVLRGHDEWKLVAAATTGPVDAFRSVGVEHTWVSRREEDCPAELAPDWAPPVLDDMHVHRLQSEYADLYERLEKLSDVPPVFRERVIFPLTRALMEAALQVEGYPQELRGLWEAVKANREPGQAAWAAYNSACNAYFMQVGATRPGGFTDDLRPDQVSAATHSYHRGQWTAARAMEHLSGWSAQPMPLSDMVYAAAAIGRGDIRAELEPRLRMIEDELGRS